MLGYLSVFLGIWRYIASAQGMVCGRGRKEYEDEGAGGGTGGADAKKYSPTERYDFDLLVNRGRIELPLISRLVNRTQALLCALSSLAVRGYDDLELFVGIFVGIYNLGHRWESGDLSGRCRVVRMDVLLEVPEGEEIWI